MSRAKEVQVTISSAKNLKNVNWRNGSNKPYAVVWIDPRNKCSTRVDEEGDTSPKWNETLVIPLPHDINEDDDKLSIDIIHAGHEEDTKPLVGSARLKLRDVIEEVGYGVPYVKTLKLKRSSGRPQGKLEVTVTLKEPSYHQAPRSYNDEPYGVRQAPPPQYDYGSSYGQPPQQYGQQPPQQYGGYQGYEQSGYQYEEKKEKESKFGGMGTGLAIGAVAGVLGGVALSEGFDAFQDNVAEEAAEKVEEDREEEDDD